VPVVETLSQWWRTLGTHGRDTFTPLTIRTSPVKEQPSPMLTLAELAEMSGKKGLGYCRVRTRASFVDNYSLTTWFFIL